MAAAAEAATLVYAGASAATARAKMALTNPSRLPVYYEWDLPERLANVLAVSPQNGVLRGHEVMECEWTFSPQAERQYLIKVPCLVSAVDDSPDGAVHELVKQTLTISGVGDSGEIRAEPEHLSFDTVLVGSTVRKSITLLNSSRFSQRVP